MRYTLSTLLVATTIVAIGLWWLLREQVIATADVSPNISLKLYFPDFWEVSVPVLCDVIVDQKVVMTAYIDNVDPEMVHSVGPKDYECLASPDGRYVGILRPDRKPGPLTSQNLNDVVLVVFDLNREDFVSGAGKLDPKGKAIFDEWKRTATEAIPMK
jgi:hypothetical protein